MLVTLRCGTAGTNMSFWQHCPNPTYLSFLPVSLPEDDGPTRQDTGLGSGILQSRYKSVRFSNVLVPPSQRDRLAEDCIALRAFHPIGALVTISKLDDVQCPPLNGLLAFLRGDWVRTEVWRVR
jgi:hypothetical protein